MTFPTGNYSNKIPGKHDSIYVPKKLILDFLHKQILIKHKHAICMNTLPISAVNTMKQEWWSKCTRSILIVEEFVILQTLNKLAFYIFAMRL